MAYTSQQIADLTAQLLNEGYSQQDILTGAARYGITPEQVMAAASEANPGLYPSAPAAPDVQQLIRDSMAQGFGAQDIAKGAYKNGISVDQLTTALQGMNPDVYGNADTMTGARNTLTDWYKGFATPTPTPAPQQNSGAPGPQSYGSFANWNPYMGLMGDDIQRRTNLGLQDAFNSIRSNAVGVGGLGGSRQGVAEGVATGRAMDSLQGNLGNVYGGLWEGAQNRGLSQYGIDTNAALTSRGQDMNFYGQQRGQDLQQLGLGANIYDMGVRGGWAPLGAASNIFNTTAGNSVTQTNNNNQGGGWQGAVGGALAGGSFGRSMGWW